MKELTPSESKKLLDDMRRSAPAPAPVPPPNLKPAKKGSPSGIRGTKEPKESPADQFLRNLQNAVEPRRPPMQAQPLSLERLNRVRPEEIEIENPECDPLYKARLLWMLDNQPQLTLDLYRRQALKSALVKNLQAATLSLVRMTARGSDEREARELVLETVVAPSGPQPTSSLTPEQEEEILHALLD